MNIKANEQVVFSSREKSQQEVVTLTPPRAAATASSFLVAVKSFTPIRLDLLFLLCCLSSHNYLLLFFYFDGFLSEDAPSFRLGPMLKRRDRIPLLVQSIWCCFFYVTLTTLPTTTITRATTTITLPTTTTITTTATPSITTPLQQQQVNKP
jgi:hypothetical protein